MAKHANECPAHSFGIGETNFVGDDFDRLRATLDALPGHLDSQALDGLGRCLPRFGKKGAAELPGAQAGHGSQALSRQ
ncbi:hypothetical protein G6F65_015252 [Rhizopus arrhizus]|nr:hypothetical protein G6F65_015252 [Rhizopus arrhizus]